MAWEQRGNNSYYYRSRKIGGRVVKEYIGAGLTAEIVAARDEAARERRHAERERERAELRRLAAIEAEYAVFARACDALAAAALLAVGYRQHARGAWRKRRDGETDEAKPASRAA